MELMVSIVLIVLIVLFLYGAIGSMKFSNQTFAKHDQQENNRTKIFELLYKDMIQSVSSRATPTKDKKFTFIELQTKNSLHEIAMPYVTYFVHAQSDSLIRLEAAKKIVLPISYEDRFAIHADTILNDVSAFNIYFSSSESNATTEDSNASDTNSTGNTRTALIYIEAKSLEKNLLVELAI
jgi:hypothetical protein